VFSKAAMASGTELTFDYQWGHHSARQKTVCLCGTPSCRGYIEVDDWVDEVNFTYVHDISSVLLLLPLAATYAIGSTTISAAM
jgi:hypothetical protein